MKISTPKLTPQEKAQVLGDHAPRAGESAEQSYMRQIRLSVEAYCRGKQATPCARGSSHPPEQTPQ